MRAWLEHMRECEGKGAWLGCGVGTVAHLRLVLFELQLGCVLRAALSGLLLLKGGGVVAWEGCPAICLHGQSSEVWCPLPTGAPWHATD